MLPLDGQHKPYPFLSSPFSVRDVAFSPDGRWVAYGSNESGEYKVYVAPFPGPGGKWQVSPAGYCPRWRRDGKELYYDSADNHLMAVEVQAHAAHVELGPARRQRVADRRRTRDPHRHDAAGGIRRRTTRDARVVGVEKISG